MAMTHLLWRLVVANVHKQAIKRCKRGSWLPSSNMCLPGVSNAVQLLQRQHWHLIMLKTAGCESAALENAKQHAADRLACNAQLLQQPSWQSVQHVLRVFTDAPQQHVNDLHEQDKDRAMA
jgi:hypothetical protein